jgi:Mn2+/Fe2+ NRAMP family transporter
VIPNRPSRRRTQRRRAARRWVWGPGLVVMLAGTDVGSLVTAGQSGARFGYAMVLPQLALVPVLYLVQEATARLGVATGRGQGALVRERFGRPWALAGVALLVASSLGALVIQLAGVAGAAELFGLPPDPAVLGAAGVAVGVAMAGSYRRAERTGLALGLAELALLPAAVLARPSPGALAHGLARLPLGDPSYLKLLAANVGAAVMPWMVYYQQGAVLDRGLQEGDLAAERRDTALGALAGQVVTVAAVVAVAATRRPGAPLDSVAALASALRPSLGDAASRALVGTALLGAGMVAALVASLAGAWGLSEVLGWRHSLNERPGRATAAFWLTYGLGHLGAAAVVLASPDPIGLVVDLEVLNALALPVVLGSLLALEARALPPEQRTSGARRLAAQVACAAAAGLGLAALAASLARA